MSTNRESDWRQVEHAASEQAIAGVFAAELVPLEIGRTIAWAECSHGHTNGLSMVHRVGEVRSSKQLALCGAEIPATIRILPLTPGLVRSLGRCEFCDDVYVQRAEDGVSVL